MAEKLLESYSTLEDKIVARTEELQREVSVRIEAESSLLIARDKAEEASRLKSLFLANISHEIRTPLNAIIGFSESIMISSELKEAHEQSKTVLGQAETLLDLINDLLDNAKIEAGKLELDHHQRRVCSRVGKKSQGHRLCLPDGLRLSLRLDLGQWVVQFYPVGAQHRW